MLDERPPSTGTATGDPFCGSCGYSFKGLEQSIRCPECGKPIIEVLMRPEFGGRLGKRYRSEATLFGLPVVDVAFGPFGQERRGRARGIIAVGDSAFGWLAIGGSACGIVAIGGVAIGIFTVGGISVGLLTAIGGLAVCLGIANGGLAVGAMAFGGLALGIVAEGGLAAGMFARGGLAVGNAFPPTFSHFRWLLGSFPANPTDFYRPIICTLASLLLSSASMLLLALICIGRARFPMNANNRRGLRPIRDHHDCRDANDKLIRMMQNPEQVTTDDKSYMNELRKAIDRYLKYCPRNSIQATPSHLVDYLLEYVRPEHSIASVAEALRIPYLQAIVDGYRAPSDEDKRKLVEFFGVSPDAFDGKRDHEV